MLTAALNCEIDWFRCFCNCCLHLIIDEMFQKENSHREERKFNFQMISVTNQAGRIKMGQISGRLSEEFLFLGILLLCLSFSLAQVPDSAQNWIQLISANGVRFSPRNGRPKYRFLCFISVEMIRTIFPQVTHRVCSSRNFGLLVEERHHIRIIICKQMIKWPMCGIQQMEVRFSDILLI